MIDKRMNKVHTYVLCTISIFREQRKLLVKCAATSLSSKLIARQKDFFSEMVVDAVSLLDEMLPLNMIGIKKVTGGSLEVIKRGESNINNYLPSLLLFFLGVSANCWCGV